MANFPTERLLQLPPFEALLIQYNETFATSLNPRYIELVSVSGNTGASIQVTLKAKDVPPNKEERRFSGQCTINVHRLNIAELFPSGVSMHLQDGLVSRDVARILGERTGIHFTELDFVDTLVTASQPIVQVNPESLRWYGQLTVNPI